MTRIACLVSVTLFACATTSGAFAGDPKLAAGFIDSEGKANGEVRLTDTPNGLLLEVELSGLEPGWHGFHLHQSGNCDTPDFRSAGEHFQPGGSKHGIAMKQGPHAGDLPNIHVGTDGKAKFQLFANGLRLHEGGNALLDADGAALIVHAQADDYASQPSGDAGERVACARIDGKR